MGSVEFALKEDERECEVIGSYASNCNVNFEGVRMRSGKMWHFSSVCFSIFARAIHTCSQTARDIPPIHIEVLVVKIWRYFHQSTLLLMNHFDY